MTNSFYAQDGQFWLNDEPLFIQAGEFHYYRTPAEEWAHRLGLLQQAGFNAVAAYMPWLWHQPQPGVTDLYGHGHPMRNLAGFLDLAAEMGLYTIARPGPYIMAETINEGVPLWVFERYPQAAFIAQDGQPQNVASYLHPDFLRCVEDWYKAVFEVLTPRQITRGGSILLVQLDNEMGMIQWIRNIIDTNPDTLARFAAYLKETYGAGLARRYATADLVAFLREQIMQPASASAASVLADYRRFYRVYLREYAAFLWERATARGLEVPPVANIHGTTHDRGGRTFPIGLSQLIDVIELDGMISATDVYPGAIGEGNIHQLLLLNAMTQAVQNPQQPLFSLEFQAGGNQDFSGAQSSLYDLHSRLSISCGMRAINHYLFFDGENDPVLSPIKRHDWGHPVRKDGTLRRHYHRYGRLSQTLAAYGQALVLARPKTVATVGFLLDHFMTEVRNDASRPADDILIHQREVVLFDFLARGLTLTHRPFDALELSRAPLDPAQTPFLFVMMEQQCDAATQEKLAQYARQGGRLLLAGRMCVETLDHTPCTVVQDALGVQVLHRDPPFTPARISAFEYTDVPVSFLETYTGDVDEVFATTEDGAAVGFSKRVGSGQVIVFGAALAANTLDDLDILHQMATLLGCAPLFTLSGDWADVRLSQGENGSFLFVNNYQDDPVETVIDANGAPLLGGHAVALPARRGVILPIEWHVRPGVVIHYLTAEVTGISEDGTRLLIHTDPAAFYAELSLDGYHAAEALIGERMGKQRVMLHGTTGVIELSAVDTNRIS